jgi:hypothetical protein
MLDDDIAWPGDLKSTRSRLKSIAEGTKRATGGTSIIQLITLEKDTEGTVR